MSRGGSFGGGQSSLGYLFGSDEQKTPPPVPSPTAACIPPYGIETPPEKSNTAVCTPPYGIETPPEKLPGKQDADVSNSNNYPRAQGQNSGNFITNRPSTKVKSVPGGDSSLGYMFGDK